MAPFTHLHVHSCFSFHDGVDTPAALVERAAALGYAALALTDTNGLYGAVAFCKAAKAAGIAPLLGAEIDGGNAKGARAVVLARGRAGYPALCRLVTWRHLDQLGEETRVATGAETDAGVARRGGLRRADRREHGGGPQRQDPGALHGAVTALARLIVPEAGAVIVLAAAPALLGSLAPLLPPGTLYGELVYAGDASSAARCRETLAACRALGLPFAATNAVRFAAPAGFATHRVLRAIGENGTVWSVPPRAHAAHFLKSPAEMAALFAHLPAALDATARIAEECAGAPELGRLRFPEAKLPPGETPFSVLWQKSFEGLRRRYRPISREAVERLRYELSIIEEKGFSPYFLVVDEIAAKAREWGLRTIGRGSAANSLVSHCLGLTHVDPLAHGLFFERFLNPERSSPPDIDLDFSWKDRDRLLAWVYERFGAEHVAMISTHVTFGPRAAVREAGKAHGLPDAELTRLTKRIPHWGSHDLTDLAATVPECRSLPAADETLRRVLAVARRLEGLPRHLSVHAGGIVIAPEPLTNFLPLERAAKGLVVTQPDMGPVEQLGLVKIDLLSQRSLGVLQDAVAAVERHTGTAPPVDERDVVLDDPETRRLVREGRTIGCFYIESPAMRSLLRKLQTETFEELTAASSVIRPGVAESGMMQEYIRRHHLARERDARVHQADAGGMARRGGLRRRSEASTAEVRSDRTPQATGTSGDDESWYLHPKLAEVLRETHGVMIYQEDVLRVAHALAGMSLGQADTLRRSMSGKLRSPGAIAQVRAGFVAGCLAGGVGRDIAAETWRQIESFAGYAFCKAHSASYALLSLQVAYLKAHHPAEFMAAVISNQGGFYATAAYVSESRRMGLRILLPDVNRSDRDYVGRGRELRMGLMAFAGLAEATIAGLLAARREGGPFTNLSDLLSRSGLGRAELELLVRGGACDSFELTRPELLWRLACRFRADGGEGEMFPGSGGLDHLVPRLPEYDLRERCRLEEEIFGFMVTRHPLEFMAGEPGQPSPRTRPPLITAADMTRHAGRRVRMRGLAISYKRIPTKAGTWMKFLSLEDLTGTFEAVLFPDAYARCAEATLGTGPLLVEGRVERDHGVPSLTVTSVEKDPAAAL
ncbi:MAG: DNA polymerase III subunit alpha [Candidatus Methylomirabilia bacterium]